MENNRGVSNELFKLAIDSWFLIYEEYTGERYEFTAKDGNHLKQLLNKIRRKHKSQDLSLETEALNNSFTAFVKSIRDRWILDNLEIAIINSKFNSIYADAKKRNSADTVRRLYLKWSD